MTLALEPVDGIGEVRPGDDVAAIIAEHATLQDGDVVVVTSKIVSKAAGLAAPDKEQLLAEQTDRVVAERGGTRIVRTHHGLTMAAAGIDASNVETGSFLPLPPDPDASAREIRAGLARLTGCRVAVVVSDTAGRAWRNGQTDIAIGCAGLLPLDPFTGREDSYGNPLLVTAPAVADEVAGAAELASGKLGRRPVVVVRGLDERLLTEDDGPGAASIVRDEDSDLFGLGSREAVVAALAGPSRGFPITDAAPEDIVGLAAVPDGVTVTVDGATIQIESADPVAAGEIRQRLLALAHAHRLEVSVEASDAR
ncbi:coenzyme F420-0:L-glutamate ligase [Aeromicrobium terrae]|uniref:Coenzyme F420-0:L-glutamate ligase n=1 Tax=Aeromicrobium terrae TaxID=2498846 RepID=A0A5C8NHX6_9ACTN|nr:coenzyme F420-0:L-glutamate ligase [Aeromicrobium terrae]TXL60686.1 coenzyme F420-0:L-glutamate ligase [Aeromicrobium terrae]